MECIINRRLLGYLEKHQLINDHQYGFRNDRSADDLLTLLIHPWANQGNGEIGRGSVTDSGIRIESRKRGKIESRDWHRNLTEIETDCRAGFRIEGVTGIEIRIPPGPELKAVRLAERPFNLKDEEAFPRGRRPGFARIAHMKLLK
ncbi:hypothetical protein EVAR_45684_1 [Eumeta japonica]|uniref:Uncharacterized protein n=1 Tax=Eumeta variegata TaxID=151549 RepID=A0A4C1XLZ5_EUMVA|nr:hypothetical protein EVAR_45684_1 [Eumeta japonica]